MSELKVILATPHPKMKNACDGAIEVYLKSEADAYIRKLKYKRCVAIAGLCDAKADWYYSIGENFIDCVQFNIKWRDKWLELAEKFKEAK